MKDDSLVGTLFAGRFQIESVLGEGGMGAVYLARHAVLDRLFAVKVIRSGLITDAPIAARFRREARAASRVEHPNVTAVVDFGHTADGCPYLVLEHVEGETLAAVIDRDSPLAVPRALRILGQVADALGAAHARQVVHRDLKPQNIMLTSHRGRADRVKVLDFGLAKIVGSASSMGLSRDGETLGTPAYISPEQCAGRPVDHRADIYGFGATAFDLLVGSPPFSGPVVAVVTAHVRDAPPAPSQRRADLPEAIDALVLRCLAKDPDQRYQSAAELLEAIHAVRRELGDQSRRRRLAMYFDEETGSISYDDFGGPRDTHESLDGWDDESTADWSRRGGETGAPPDIEELACALRDQGLGSSRISAVLAQKVAADDQVFALRSEIATLEANVAEVETSAHSRATRLRQALAQLEHERGNLARAASGETLPLGSRALTAEVDLRSAQLEQNAAGIARSLRELDEQTEQRVAALQAEIARRRQSLSAAQLEAEHHLAALAELVAAAQQHASAGTGTCRGGLAREDDRRR